MIHRLLPRRLGGVRPAEGTGLAGTGDREGTAGQGAAGREAVIRKIASVLLQYPDARVLGALDDIEAALGTLPAGARRDALGRFAGWLRSVPAEEAARHHVATFDLTRRCCPYLSYFRYGDTRQRGMALLMLKNTYRAAGFEPVESELPDYLPAMLEFAALAPGPGTRLLRIYRPALELLRLALEKEDSPYAGLVGAVCAGLGGLRPRDAEGIRRLAAEGPPTESVGVGPTAPPDFLDGAHLPGAGSVPGEVGR